MALDIPPNWPGAGHPASARVCQEFGFLLRHGFGKPEKLLRGDTSLNAILGLSVVEAAADGPYAELRLLALRQLLSGYVAGLGQPAKDRLDFTTLSKADQAALKEERTGAVLAELIQLAPGAPPEGAMKRRQRVITDPALWPWFTTVDSLRVEERGLRQRLASWICDLDLGRADAGALGVPADETLSSVQMQTAESRPRLEATSGRTGLAQLQQMAARLALQDRTGRELQVLEAELRAFFAVRPYLDSDEHGLAETLDRELELLIDKADPQLSARLRLHRARLRDSLGRWQEALDDLRAALEIPGAPRNDLLFEATAMLFNLGEWVQMGAVAEQALLSGLDPAQSAMVRYWHLCVLDYQGRSDHARAQLIQLRREQRALGFPTHAFEHRWARIAIKKGERRQNRLLIQRAKPVLTKSASGEDPANPFPRLALYGVSKALEAPDRRIRREDAEGALEAGGQRVAGHLQQLHADHAGTPSERRSYLTDGVEAWTVSPYSKGVFDLSLDLGWSYLEDSPSNPRLAAPRLRLAVILGERMRPERFREAQQGFAVAAHRLGIPQARLATKVEDSFPSELEMFVRGWRFDIPGTD